MLKNLNADTVKDALTVSGVGLAGVEIPSLLDIEAVIKLLIQLGIGIATIIRIFKSKKTDPPKADPDQNPTPKV